MRALLPNDPLARNACLLALLAFFGAYFFYTYLHRPRLQRAETLTLRIDQLASLRQQHGAGLVPGVEDAGRHLEAYSAYLARLEALIPTSEDVAALLAAISVEERRTGVEVMMLRPEPREPGEVYDRWSYQIVVRGRYHQIASFMTAIASLHRIMIPSDVNITAELASPADEIATSASLVASFLVRTHVGPGPHDQEALALPAEEDSNLSGRLIYEREFFVYTARQRDPFLPPGRLGTTGTFTDGIRLLGIIHHDRTELSVVLLGNIPTGVGAAGSRVPEGRPRETVRLRLGQALGDVRLSQIHSDHIVLEVDMPEGVVRRILQISQTHERIPS